MSLQTNLKGRLRNTSLSKNHGLMPVFEAVVNSIHSIEEQNDHTKQGTITLRIHREAQQHLDLATPTKPNRIVSFSIIDNGCGFNDINFASFETLDSDHKIDKGCRGVGRLMWLKTFDHVEITSHFHDPKSSLKQRHFRFDTKHGVHSLTLNTATQSHTGTEVKLIGFDLNYAAKVPSDSKQIATQLLEHVLWYFVREERAPKIIVEDNEQSIDLDSLYDQYMHESAYNEEISIRDQLFQLTHIKFRASVNKRHQLALCAANRLVKEESIQGKIPGLYNKITDEKGEFIYTCYVSSDFLTERVRSERTSFEISDHVDHLLNEISFKDIRDAVYECTKKYLNDMLIHNIAIGRQRVDSFINNHAPRYKPLINYVDEALLIFDPDRSDKELELHLHTQWYEIEQQIVAEGHSIRHPFHNEKTQAYKIRLAEYLKKAGDLKKSDLANYVSHRKIIIDLLQDSIKKLTDGQYAKEAIIHELIMPMRKDSTEISTENCNLWLVDERLAFHHYLASDKPLRTMPITECDSTKEPDILSLRLFDNPILVNDKENGPLASITVIEIKRPMRNDMAEGEDKNPIDQALGYLERVREGRIKTTNGRPIPQSNNIPGYCYIICDLTDSMIRRCRRANLRVTSDGMGYFGYNEPSHAYIEVIGFEQLVQSAKERNRAFFDALGLPTV